MPSNAAQNTSAQAQGACLLSPTPNQLQQAAQAVAELHGKDRVTEIIGKYVPAGANPVIASVPTEQRQALFFELDMLANPSEVYVPPGAPKVIDQFEADYGLAGPAALPDPFPAIPRRLKTMKRWLLHKCKVPHYVDGSKRTGALDSPADIARLGTYAEALAALKTRPEFGLGFAIVAGDGIIALDADKVLGHEKEAETLALFGKTYIEISPSGSGLHAFYFGELTPAKNNLAPFECYIEKRYFTVTGNRHPGSAEDVADATPEDIERIAAVFGTGDEAAVPAGDNWALRMPPTAQQLADINAMIDDAKAKGLHLSKAGHEQLWSDLACAFCMVPGGEELFIRFSEGDTEFSEKDCLKKLNEKRKAIERKPELESGIAGAISRLMREGIANPATGRGRSSAAEALGDVPPDEVPPVETKAPNLVVWPPGVVGEIASYILASSRMPVPSFAIAGALTVASYMIRNMAYVAPSNTGLNLYTVLIGATGKGKEDPRKAIKRILDAMDQHDLLQCVSETLSSGTALLRAISGNEKHHLMLSDEYGMFMQAAMAGKDDFRRDLVKELMSMYGLARSFHSGKRYADARQNIDQIDNPYIVTLGTTTEEELFPGLNMMAINNGSANRNIYIYADANPKPNRRPQTAIPAELLNKLTTLFNVFAQAGETELEYGPGAEEMIAEFGDNLPTTGKFVNLWSRAEENAIRIAGVLAFCDGKVITVEHIRWAIDYMKAALHAFERRAETQISEGMFDKQLNKALEIISNARHYGDDHKFSEHTTKGKMPRGKLIKLMKNTKPRELDEIIAALREGRQIRCGEEAGVTVYWQA